MWSASCRLIAGLGFGMVVWRLPAAVLERLVQQGSYCDVKEEGRRGWVAA